MKRLLALLLGFALSGCAGTSGAGTLADLAVVDRTTGQRLPTYYHQGRHWVAGTPGNKYAVSVSNKSGQRVMTVISVDGVNAVTGETAAAGQDGYVLEGGMRYEITGWRKNPAEVAAFVFTTLPDSYAARTGRPDNVGVIGVAVFREWVPPRPYSHADALSSARSDTDAAEGRHRNGVATAPSSATGEVARAPREERLGTRHGEREGSQVSYASFRRASDRPSELISIYYDSHANLVARGIIRAVPPAAPAPNPFPADLRFVPDPRG